MERPRTEGGGGVEATAIRLATTDELILLPDIERRSSVRFVNEAGLEQWVGDATAMSDLVPAHDAGLVWVATEGDEVVGWCYASPADDSLFVEEIDVLPEHGRRGIGGALLDAVQAEAAKRGCAALTLTTDAHVAWNRPWYEKLGFRVIEPGEEGPDLAAKVAHEAVRGLDLRRRVAMRRTTS